VARRAGLDLSNLKVAKIEIRGRSEQLALFALPRATDLPDQAIRLPATAAQ
jgi:hypothetical protein